MKILPVCFNFEGGMGFASSCCPWGVELGGKRNTDSKSVWLLTLTLKDNVFRIWRRGAELFAGKDLLEQCFCLLDSMLIPWSTVRPRADVHIGRQVTV